MASHGNLADPDYEPTDEELAELTRSAFANVAAQNELALRKVHDEIAALSIVVKRRMAEGPAAEPAK